MQWFLNLKVAKKITSLAVSLILLMLCIGGVAYYAGAIMSDKAKEMYNDRLLPVQWLNDSRNQFRAVEADVWQLILAPADASRDKRLAEDITERTNYTSKLFADYEKTKLDPYEIERVPKLREELKIYREERKVALDLAAAGKKTEAYSYFNAKVAPHLDKINTYLQELAEYNSKVASNLRKDTEETAALVTKVVVSITMLSILLGIIITWLIARMIVNPLKDMLSSISKDANGYISIKKVKVTASDEVGELGSSLNDFTEQVRTIIKNVASSAEQLAASSQELTASAEQCALATNQVAISITAVAQGTEEQVHAVDDASGTIEQLSSGIHTVSESANVAAGTSEKTAAMARNGEKSVESAVTQMAHIEKTVNSSAHVIARLGERSKEIGQIVNTISGIAGQTNLLALNAAIEAARAGEQGRGFAVVAEEVRKLAEQSQEAAKQVATLIGEIQADTDQAVTAMHNGTREVKVGEEVVQAAGQVFAEIVGLITQVSRQVKEISSSIEQMASGSQNIVSSMQSVDKLSKEMAGQTQAVSAATQEQSATMEEIASASHALADMAQSLQASIQSFRV